MFEFLFFIYDVCDRFGEMLSVIFIVGTHYTERLLIVETIVLEALSVLGTVVVLCLLIHPII